MYFTSLAHKYFKNLIFQQKINTAISPLIKISFENKGQMLVNISTVYLNKLLILCIQLYSLVIFGFSSYTELIIFLGLGELLSTFITLGVHSAILRESDTSSFSHYLKYNFYTLIGVIILIFLFLSWGNYNYVMIMCIALSSSCIKISRALMISASEIKLLTFSYFTQSIGMIGLFVIMHPNSIEGLIFIIALMQLLASFIVLPYMSIFLLYTM